MEIYKQWAERERVKCLKAFQSRWEKYFTAEDLENFLSTGASIEQARDLVRERQAQEPEPTPIAQSFMASIKNYGGY